MPTDPSVEPAAANKPAGAPKPAAKQASPVTKIVRVTLIVLGLLFVYHLFADRMTPYSSQATVDSFLVQIAPEISGPVVAVAAQDNHVVKKGQELFRIDPLPYQIAVRSAEANLALAILNVNSSEADVRVADANLKRTRVDLATSEQLGKIILDLTAKKALSETTGIRARADLGRTSAEIHRYEAEAERARIRLGEGGEKNPQVRQALAALEQARLNLKRTSVLAPNDGVVTNLRLAPGQFAQAGGPVLSFMAAGPRWVSVAMRENQLGNIAAGNRALVTFDDHPGEVYPAHVESVGWGIAQGDEAPNGQLPTVTAPTGWLREPQRFPVRIMLDPPEDPEDALPPGRSGAQANVVVLTRDTSIMNPLARLWLRVVAIFSYLR